MNANNQLDNGVDYCIGGECEAPLDASAEALEAWSQESGVRDQESGDRKSGGTNGSRSSLFTPDSLPAGVIQRGAPVRPYLQRLSFALPARDTLPPLDKYARLEHKGERRVVGYTEASRACLHLCTHCPIPPVYGGPCCVGPAATALHDISNQVRAPAPRSRRSMAAASSWFRKTRYCKTSATRSARGRRTSPSAIPIFSTGRGTR